MRKTIVVITFSMAVLVLVASPLYASNVDEYQLRLISMEKRQAKLVDDAGLSHHIGVVKGSKGVVVIDTMQWCNETPLADLSQYLARYDSSIVWFRPVAPCSLYEIGGRFSSSGKGKLFACRWGYTSSDSSHPWPATDNLWPYLVLWTVSGDGGWEVKDFTNYPEGFILQFPEDSLFGVGFQSDADAQPYIYYDDYSGRDADYPDEDGYYHRPPHWYFTYGHDGHWYYIYYYQAIVPEPHWYPEMMMKAIVNYYEGVGPFVESTEQKSDTWLRENIKMTAVMSDLDGWITDATLHYAVSGLPDTAEVAMMLSETKKTTYLATGYFPGPFSVGDTISYWCTCVDNDGKPSKWVGTGNEVKSFVIREPQNPGAQILLVGDGDISNQRAGYYEDLLDRLGYSYEPTWFAVASHGIDSSVVLHTYNDSPWEAIIWFGWGCENLPRPDTLESESEYPVIRYLNDGGKLLIADQDYFWRKGLPSGVEISFEPGDFAYDYLGVDTCLSDPNVQDTISLGDTVFYAVTEDDPVSGDFYLDPVELYPTCVGVLNWADYTVATTEGVDIFLGVPSGSYSGTRFPSTKGVKTVFLPWCFEAIVDCADTSTLTPVADTLMWNILHDWFEIDTNAVKNIKPGFVPRSFSLSQNYPNPFNPLTSIEYSLARGSQVELSIYNVVGERVRVLVDERQRAGVYRATWDGKDGAGNEVASGVYFYRLVAGDHTFTRKMLLLK